jgi:hypothetical protein
VAKTDSSLEALQNAGREALVEPIQGLVDDRLEQGEIGLEADDGCRVEDRARPKVESCRAGQHRVPHARRHARSAGGQHLGDEERIASRLPVELVDVDTGSLGELVHAALGQRGQCDSPSRLDVAKDEPQWVLWADLVVAVRRDHERRRSLEPATEVAEEIERCLVRPMHVLDNGDRCARAERLEHGCEDIPPTGGPLEIWQELVQWRERLRSEQPVAGGPEDARLARLGLDECADERGLPDPGLAPDEHEPAVARGRGAEMLAESGEVPAPLDQLHLEIVGQSASGAAKQCPSSPREPSARRRVR